MATVADTWRPTSDLEHRLQEAVRAGDQEGYFRLIGDSELVIPVPPGLVEGMLAGEARPSWPTQEEDGRVHVLVYTSAAAMRACLGPSYRDFMTVRFGEIAETWPDDRWWLAVDVPGHGVPAELPIEARLPSWFVRQVAGGDGRPPRAGRTPAPWEELRDQHRELPREPAADVRAAAHEPPAAAPGSPRPEFQPANDVERELLRAAAGNDHDLFLQTLAAAEVLLPVPDETDYSLRPGRPGFPWRTREADGSVVVPVFTSPERLVEASDGAGAEYIKLPFTVALRYWPNHDWLLAINSGSPAGGTVLAQQLPGLATWADQRAAQRMTEGFEPQNDIEQRLFDAARRRDTDAFFKILLSAQVLVPADPDTPWGITPDDPGFPWRPVPVHGRAAIQVFTSLKWMNEAVGSSRFIMPTLQDVVAAWPDTDWTLVLNPGTPIDAAMPGDKVRSLGGLPAEPAASADATGHEEERSTPLPAGSAPGVPETSAMPGDPPGGPPADHPETARPAVPPGGEAPHDPAASAMPGLPGAPADHLGGPAPHDPTAPPETMRQAGTRHEPDAPAMPGDHAGDTHGAYPEAGRHSMPQPGEPAPHEAGAAAVPGGHAGGPPAGYPEGAQRGAPYEAAAPGMPGDHVGGAPGAYPEAAPDEAGAAGMSGGHAGGPAGAFPESPRHAGSQPGDVPHEAGVPDDHVSAYSQAAQQAGAPGGEAGVAPGGPDPRAAGDAAAGFEPGNRIDQELYDAALGGDSDGFLRVLLSANVLVPIPGDAPLEVTPVQREFRWDAALRSESAVRVFTSLVRLREELPETRFVYADFRELIGAWPREDWTMALNPGTLIGASLRGDQVRALSEWAVRAGLVRARPETPLPQSRPEPQPQPQPEAQPQPEPEAAPRPQHLPAEDLDDRVMSPSILQKVVPHGHVAWYLEQGYDRVGGFVHGTGDVAELQTPVQLYEALGLLYEGSPFSPGDDGVYVIRWPGYCPDLYRIPFGGRDEGELAAWGEAGWVIERPPFLGNGFAPGSAGSIREYKVDSVRLPYGAEMYYLAGDRSERFIAMYDPDRLAWLRPDAGAETWDGRTEATQ